ncbi:MAG: DUF4185 domain-containing protein [Chloroflexota bacterium]|nr:DUF4185 domain-containing protein [Chloroflexota bacterium]
MGGKDGRVLIFNVTTVQSVLPGPDVLGPGEGGFLGAHVIAQLTGPGSLNRTDTQWNLYGTDLGHMFEHGDRTYFVFGDSYGPDKRHPRSNAMAWSDDHEPSGGLHFDGMIVDGWGWAKELLPAKKLWGIETTVIPTAGISDGQRMYLHYMSVRRWGKPGHWRAGHAGMAYSDDTGQTWTKHPGARWPGNSNFVQAAFVRHGDHVYMFGIPAGRFGAPQLARVAPDSLLNGTAYRYWTGSGWDTDRHQDAGVLLPGPVGELSVQWNSYYGKWLMLYLNEHRAAIVLRTADTLTGPWGAEIAVVGAATHPQLYAPYITPRWNDGPDIYFTLSLFGPYNVYLMRTALRGRG